MQLRNKWNKAVNTLLSIEVELVATRIIIILITFLVSPIVLSNVGSTSYGLYSILLGLGSLFTLFDLGISNYLVSNVAELNEKKRFQEINVNISTAFQVISIPLLIMFFGCFVIVGIVPWSDFFVIPKDQLRHFENAVQIALFGSGINLLANACGKLLLGLGRNSAYNRLNLGLIAGISLFQVVFGQGSYALEFLSIGAFVLPGIFNLYSIILVRRSLPTLRIKYSKGNIQRALLTLSSSVSFWYIQLISIVSYQVDSVVGAAYLNPSELTVLNFSSKVFLIPIALVTFAFTPLWSRIASQGEGFTRADVWIEWKRCIVLPVKILLFLCLVTLLFGSKLIKLWTSGQVIPPTNLISASAFWVVLGGLMAPAAMMFNGMKSKKFLIISGTSFMFISTLFTFVLYSVTGSISSSVWAKIFASVFCFFIPFVYNFSRATVK
jgi:O-antigen/teichoic acid export membrane protein